MARCDPKNTSVYRADPVLAGVSVLAADFTTLEYAPHSHEALVVATTDDGGAVINSRGANEGATPDELFVFNPTEPHSTRMAGSVRWQFQSIYLTGRGLADLGRHLNFRAEDYFTRNVFRDPELIGLFRNLQQTLLSGDDTFEKHELMALAFGVLFKRYGSGKPASVRGDNAVLRQVTEQMRSDYAEDLQLEALAEKAGLSVWQLISIFKRTIGLTPHAYLTQIRLSAACRRLRHCTIAEAAAETGFYDQSSLTKHFKRSYGMTPRQFAEASQTRYT